MNNFSEEFLRFLHDKDVTIAKQSHYKKLGYCYRICIKKHAQKACFNI